ncbi:MAG: NAD(P)/FAD-dependent oxidoreductase [Elusimicrobiota bacterium]
MPTASVAATPQTTQVVIIGAGLSGLDAAYQLKKAGVSYHILELTARVGGRVHTARYQRPGEPEIYSDSGMEEYWESNPAVALMKELKLPALEGIAASSIILDKTLYPLKDETTLQFQKRIFNKPEMKAFLAFKAKVAPWIAQLQTGKVPEEIASLKDKSFADLITAEGLPRKVSEWIRVSLECEIATSWSAVSALDGLADFHIFMGDGEKCYRVPGGNVRFVNAIADVVGHDNISLNQRVTSVETFGDKVMVYYLDAVTNESRGIEASHVISTIPLYRLFQIQFKPPLSEKKREAIDTLSWGSYFKVHAFVPKAAQSHWMDGAFSSLPILSDSNIGVVYEGNPDQDGPTKVVSLLIYGRDAEAYNMMPADDVRAQVMEGFDKLWPGFSKEIKEMQFHPYHPRAIASWPVGRSRFDALSQTIREPEHRVYLAGDFTETSHSDGAFISAERVVRQILAAR